MRFAGVRTACRACCCLVPELKSGKNRFHLEFRPDDRDAEVSRLVALGASPIDIGQGDPSWVVLGDSEGNEFWVLGSKRRSD